MVSDLRLALRRLANSPGFAAAAILTLALGIGANTTIFSVINGVLLRPAPVDDIERLVMIWETDRTSGTTREPASVPDFLDYKAAARSIAAIGAVMAADVTLTGLGDPVQLAELRISHDLLPMLGIQPSVGRGFAASEDRPGGPAVAMISESLWRRGFLGSPSVAGSTIRLDERVFTVVGIVPDAADFGVLQILSAAAYGRAFADRRERTRVDVWVPLQADPQTLPRATHPIFMLARLAPGATPASAQQEFTGLAADLERQFPENRGRGVHVEVLADVVFGPVRPTLYVLLGAVTLVLLIACVNVAGLLLARGTGRAQEVAVRRATGATSRHLVRQFLAEGLVLAALGTIAGIGLAYAALAGLIGVAPADIPRVSTISMDVRMLALALTIAVVAGIAFAVIPSAQARRMSLALVLKQEVGERTSAGPGAARARTVLVIGELALAVVLLAAAGLMLRSFWNLRQVDPGFRAQGVAKAEYKLPATRYPADFRRWPNFSEQHAFTNALLERIAALPGVTSAAVAGNHPMDPGFTNSFAVVGREAEARAWPEISVRRVTPGYFSTVDLRIVAGRLPAEGDTTAALPVTVINEAAARRFFDGRDPIGADIRLYGASRKIVGVVRDEKFRGLGEPSPLALYLPLSQAPSANGAGVLLVRTEGDPGALLPAIRRAIHAEDPELAVFGLEPLSATVSRSPAERRFAMLLLALFAAVALLLAVVGIHGMFSYEIARRRREVGVRMALGAGPARILRLVVRQGLLLTAVAVCLGIAGAVALTRFLGALLFGVGPLDPVTLTAVAAILGSVALTTTGVAGWRASRIDPAAALRGE